MLRGRGVGVAGYLARLGLDETGPPSVDALADLQARHLDRVVFENLEIQRGRPTTVDYADSAERIVKRGRGGYCFHLNGAFGLLLEALGYEVSRRRGTVQPLSDGPPGRLLNHLVVLVHGLPTGGNPQGTWWVEVGFGDGPIGPLALRAGGAREDDPHTYAVEPSPVYAGGWRLLQEGGSSGILDADTAPPPAAEVAAAHERLSTSPESGFVRTATFQRRRAGRVDVLRARLLSRVERDGTHTTLLADEREWFAALADVFGLELPDVDAAERRALWERVRVQHDAWAAQQDG